MRWLVRRLVLSAYFRHLAYHTHRKYSTFSYGSRAATGAPNWFRRWHKAHSLILSRLYPAFLPFRNAPAVREHLVWSLGWRLNFTHSVSWSYDIAHFDLAKSMWEHITKISRILACFNATETLWITGMKCERNMEDKESSYRLNLLGYWGSIGLKAGLFEDWWLRVAASPEAVKNRTACWEQVVLAMQYLSSRGQVLGCHKINSEA